MSSKNDGYPSFEEVWQKYIMPLKGQTLQNTKGPNKIIDVDSSGLTRISSEGNRGKIEIDGFRFAYDTLLKEGEVTRDYINENVGKRCSSGICLVLRQIPFVLCQLKPKMTLKLNGGR